MPLAKPIKSSRGARIVPSGRVFKGVGLVLAVWLGILTAPSASFAMAGPAPPAKPASAKTAPAPSASALYQKTLDSDTLYSYSGREFQTTWYEDGRSSTTVARISHLAPGDFRFVYSSPARYRGVIYLQVGGQQWTYLPRKNEVLHGAPHIPISRAPAAKFSLLNKNYRLVVSPHPTRIADRKVYELSMISRASGKPLHRIWIDPYTGLVLRREDLRPDGSYAFVSYYSDIDFHPNFPKYLFSEAQMAKGDDGTVSIKELHKQVGVVHQEARAVEATRVPVSQVAAVLRGAAVVPPRLGRYVLQSAEIIKSGSPTIELHYSDGLKALSLVESLRTSKYPTNVPNSHAVIFSRGEVGRGARKDDFNLLSWDTARLNLTLIGDVSMQVLARFARQVQGH